MKLTEAFQTSSGGGSTAPPAAPPAAPTAPQAPQTCPAAALSSFPIQLTTTSTNRATLYDSVENPPAIEFSWGSRTTPPRFLPNLTVAKLDEADPTISTNQTTLRFRATTYTLSSVQFIKNSHTSWLLEQANANQNKEDALLIFETNSDTQAYKYIMFVIPVLRVSEAIEPTYFQGLAGTLSTAPPGSSFQVRQLLPSDKNAQFAYYTTCINGYSELAATRNVYVFVAVEGLKIRDTLMSTIKNQFSNAASTFPTRPEAPFMTRFSGRKVEVGVDFPNYVNTTRYLLDSAGGNSYQRSVTTNVTQRNIQEETLDPYKCVPFDPDTQVEDGKVRIDEETGIPLKTILEERTALRDTTGEGGAAGPAGGGTTITTGKLGKVISDSLGYLIVGLLGLFLLLLTIYMVYKSRMRPSAEEGALFSAAASRLSGVPQTS